MSDDHQFRQTFSVITGKSGPDDGDHGPRTLTNLHVVEPEATEVDESQSSVRELPLDAQTFALRAEVNILRQEHKDLDDSIHALELMPVPDQILILRLKRKKLSLRDQIAKIEDKIRPDIIA